VLGREELGRSWGGGGEEERRYEKMPESQFGLERRGKRTTRGEEEHQRWGPRRDVEGKKRRHNEGEGRETLRGRANRGVKKKYKTWSWAGARRAARRREKKVPNLVLGRGTEGGAAKVATAPGGPRPGPGGPI